MRPRDVDVPQVGGSVKVRPIPPRLRRAIVAKATKGGKLDQAELWVGILVHGVVEPNFTKAEAKQIMLRFTEGTLQPIIDRINQLSGADEHQRIRFDPRVPAKLRTAIRTAAMATAWARRPSCEGQHRRAPGRRAPGARPVRRPGSRRTSAPTRAGPDDDADADGDHLDPRPVSEYRGLAAR